MVFTMLTYFLSSTIPARVFQQFNLFISNKTSMNIVTIKYTVSNIQFEITTHHFVRLLCNK